MSGAVLTRAILYALIAFFSPIAGVVVEMTRQGYYPSGIELLGATATGFIAALISIRAFIDGTAEREKQEKKQFKAGQAGDFGKVSQTNQ